MNVGKSITFLKPNVCSETPIITWMATSFIFKSMTHGKDVRVDGINSCQYAVIFSFLDTWEIIHLSHIYVYKIISYGK